MYKINHELSQRNISDGRVVANINRSPVKVVVNFAQKIEV
jgi:hypothetical protein